MLQLSALTAAKITDWQETMAQNQMHRNADGQKPAAVSNEPKPRKAILIMFGASDSLKSHSKAKKINCSGEKVHNFPYVNGSPTVISVM